MSPVCGRVRVNGCTAGSHGRLSMTATPLSANIGREPRPNVGPPPPPANRPPPWPQSKHRSLYLNGNGRRSPAIKLTFHLLIKDAIRVKTSSLDKTSASFGKIVNNFVPDGIKNCIILYISHVYKNIKFLFHTFKEYKLPKRLIKNIISFNRTFVCLFGSLDIFFH